MGAVLRKNQDQMHSLHPRSGYLAPSRGRHRPVMLDEAMRLLAPRAGGVYVDATFGAGGMSAAMLAAAANVWSLDRDPDTQCYAQDLERHYPHRLHWIHGCFGDLIDHLMEIDIHRVDGVIFDLGVSSMQLDRPERGFAIRQDGPLDMRMESHGLTAADIVNHWNRHDLKQIFTEYGEEPAAGRIADAIIAARQQKAITRTSQLAELTYLALPRSRRYGRTHPATRVFQALRIVINDELNQLSQGLKAAHQLLHPQGRIVVIAFHSLEDRIVKHAFNNRSQMNNWHRLTKRPLRPSQAECQVNPRARSARLRAAEKTM